MSGIEPKKLWWTAGELADARLPDMPGTKRRINALAERERWLQIPSGARRRAGRGGGWEYHWSVLPHRARQSLLAEVVARADDPEVALSVAEAWHRYDALSNKNKAKAAKRLEVIRTVETLRVAGATQVEAVDAAAQQIGVSERTVYNWIEMIEGKAESDWLAYLAPRYDLAPIKTGDDRAVRPFLDFLKGSFLRIAGQSFRQCHRKAVEKAEQEGWGTLIERTAMRRINKEVPRVTQVFLREGVAGLEKCFPAQIRDRSELGAMGGVNADCHKIDVFVQWPDGTINRPQIIAFQDLYSNKFLSWRVDHSPNSVMVMSAFGEMIEEYGIPTHCLFDNVLYAE